MNDYICIKDLQGGSWCVGVIDSPEGWKEHAGYWCDVDNNPEEWDYLGDLFGLEAVEEIAEYWEIVLVPVTEEEREFIEELEAQEKETKSQAIKKALEEAEKTFFNELEKRS